MSRTKEEILNLIIQYLNDEVIDDETFDIQELHDLDLSNSNFCYKANINSFNFVDFSNSNLSKSNLSETRFINCDLTGTNFKDSNINRDNMINCTEDGTIF